MAANLQNCPPSFLLARTFGECPPIFTSSQRAGGGEGKGGGVQNRRNIAWQSIYPGSGLYYQRNFASETYIPIFYIEEKSRDLFHHRIVRVLSFFSSRRNWDSPNPSPAGECAPPPPPWFRGEGHTRGLANERGGWRDKIKIKMFIFPLDDTCI